MRPGALWDIPWRPSIPLAAGTEEQKERFLRPACRGERRDAYAITEEGAGSDVSMVASTARRDGTDWVFERREVARDERRRRRLLPGPCPRGRRPGEGHRVPRGQGSARCPPGAHPEVHAHLRVRASDLRVRRTCAWETTASSASVGPRVRADEGLVRGGAPDDRRPDRGGGDACPRALARLRETNGGSSAARSPTSRPLGSCWRTWPPRSPPRSRCSTGCAGKRRAAVRIARGSTRRRPP